MNDRVVIDRRFNGPPNSANGGYTCGLVGTTVKAAPLASALYDAGGRALAVADALWIELRDPAAFGG